MNLTDKVLQFVSEINIEQLPQPVIHQAKRCTLDTLGALIAGADTPVSEMMTAFAKDHFGHFARTEATILVDGTQVSPVGATLANGFAANALDIDDGHRLVKGHPGACVLPVVLTASEVAPGTTGADFLTALVVAYEIAIRAGMIRHATSETYHLSGSWGAIGGAAAAAKIMKCDRSTLREAFGTAEGYGPIAPMMKVISKPCMVKDGIGWGAMVGLTSVLMAQAGFTGINPIFHDSPDSSWIEELGSRYRILDVYFKPHACCRWAQPAIAATMKVIQSQSISIERIKHIYVRTFLAAKALSCASPKDTEEAQYNLAYPVAVTLLDGELGPRQVLPPRIFEKGVLELSAKVTVEVDPEYERAFPSKTFAEVIIETTEGKRYGSGAVEPRWEPPNSPSDKELEEKFYWLVEPIFGRKQVEKLVELIWSLEQHESVGNLIQLAIRST